MSDYFLYLHGLNSSPNSIKANKLKEWLTVTYPGSHFTCPQLPIDPHQAITVAKQLLAESHNRVTCKFIIGSSLGGYYARYLIETDPTLTAAILINPVAEVIGLLKHTPTAQYHPYLKQSYNIDAKLREAILDYNIIHCQQTKKYLLLLQQDDEVINAVETISAFPGVKTFLANGQGHLFDKIEIAFPKIQLFIANSR